MEYFYLEQVKSKNIMCQIRTNISQPFMFFDGNHIIRGPYNEFQINNIIKRSDIFRKFGNLNIIQPINNFVTPHGIFLRFHNFLDNYELEIKPYREPFSRDSYDVAANLPIITLRRALDMNYNIWIFQEIKNLIITLCYCYIMNIGKLNIDNIYFNIDTKEIYIIDYQHDIDVNTKRDDEIFYFDERPDDKYDWFNNCKYCYNDAADFVEKSSYIFEPDNLKENLQKTVILLRKFSKSQKIIMPKIQFKNNIVSSPYKNMHEECQDNIYFLNNSKYIRLTDYQKYNRSIFGNRDSSFYSVEQAFQYYKFNYVGANNDTVEYSNLLLDCNNPSIVKIIGEQKEIEHIMLGFDVYKKDILKFADDYLNKSNKINHSFQQKSNNITRIVKQDKNDDKQVTKVSVKHRILTSPYVPTSSKQNNSKNKNDQPDVKVSMERKIINLPSSKQNKNLNNSSNKKHIKIRSSPYIINPSFEQKSKVIKSPFRLRLNNNILNYDDKGNLIMDKYENYYLKYDKSLYIINKDVKINEVKNKLNEIIRTYKNKTVVNPNWDDIKYNVMKYILYHKFNNNELDRNLLLSTGDKILCADIIPYDSFWGIDNNQKGDNMLGKLLIELRNLFREKYKTSDNSKNKSYVNIDLQVVKNKLRRYIQKSLTHKALSLANILFKIKLDMNDIYNFINDVAINDIGLANLNLVLAVINSCNAKKVDYNVFMCSIALLSESDKNGLSCYAWYAYANDNGRKISIDNLLSIDIEFNNDDVNFINKKLYSDLFEESTPINLRHYLLIFLKRLKEKDLNAFSWCYFYLETIKNLDTENIKQYDMLLWEILSFFLKKESFDILNDAYCNDKNIFFLQHAIIMVVYNKYWRKYFPKIEDFEFPKVDDDIKLDDDIYDIDNSYILIPEYMMYHDKLLRKIYCIGHNLSY